MATVIRTAVAGGGAVCNRGGPPGAARVKGTARAWARRSTGPRSVDTTGSGTARTSSDASTRSTAMLRDHPFARDEPMTGLEVELNLVDGDLEPAPVAQGGARLARVAGVPDRAGPLEPRAQPAAAAVARRAVAPLRAAASRRARDGPGEGLGPRRAAGGDRHPADAARPPPRRGGDLPGRALPAAQRADAHRPRRAHPARHHRWRPAGVRARAPASPTSTRSPPRRRARRCSCTCRCRPRRSPPTGTRRSASPACSSPSARTRRSCSVRGCGRRPGSRCSSSRATCVRPSCATRACGRGCGSASGGSPRCSTCSPRTAATSPA